MTQSDLCPICGRALADHPDGLACCPFCRENAHLEMNPRYDRVTMYRVTCNAINDNHSLSEWYTTAAMAISRWNTRAHPSPWLNAPIPEEGETQELEVYNDPIGKWAIRPRDGSGNSFSIAKGYYGGTPRTERRTMRDGKLVYEEVKG